MSAPQLVFIRLSLYVSQLETPKLIALANQSILLWGLLW